MDVQKLNNNIAYIAGIFEPVAIIGDPILSTQFRVFRPLKNKN